MTNRPALVLTPLVVLVAGATLGTPVARAAPPSCESGDVVVAASEMSPAVGHRAVQLDFSLAPDVSPCTLTGYPGVDTGSGGPLLHGERTVRGYLGGVPQGGVASTVTVDRGHDAVAVVEGVAVDGNGDQCPFYTDLLVTPPNTTDTVRVAATIDTCRLQVHPVT